jgi:hypothetical protein
VSTPRIASPNQGADRGYGRGRPGLAEAGGSGGIPRADSRQVFTGAGTGVGYATSDRRGENRTRPGGLRPLGLDPSLAVGSRSVDPARSDVRQVLGCPKRVARTLPISTWAEAIVEPLLWLLSPAIADVPPVGSWLGRSGTGLLCHGSAGINGIADGGVGEPIREPIDTENDDRR